MNEYKISEAARATGFTVSALRFYEKQGVVVPERTHTGYRSYRHENIEALRFLARAKALGLTLPEISELLGLLADEDCQPVQTRLRELVTDRITQAQDQIADLVGFTAQLQQAAVRLGIHTADGPCNDRCGCTSDPTAESPVSIAGVPLVGTDTRHVSCTLEPDHVANRVDQWQALTMQADDRLPLPDGIRLRFPRDVDLGTLTQLAADEQTCCGFFTFTIRIHPDSITLEVTGPTDAQPVIAAMFGIAA